MFYRDGFLFERLKNGIDWADEERSFLCRSLDLLKLLAVFLVLKSLNENGRTYKLLNLLAEVVAVFLNFRLVVDSFANNGDASVYVLLCWFHRLDVFVQALDSLLERLEDLT